MEIMKGTTPEHGGTEPSRGEETVESSRAERDDLANDLGTARVQCARTNEQLFEALRKADAARVALAATRVQRDEARAELARRCATHVEAEAAWARCRRPRPRRWHSDDPEPEGVRKVRDTYWGGEWFLADNESRWQRFGSFVPWDQLMEQVGPLTEVLE